MPETLYLDLSLTLRLLQVKEGLWDLLVLLRACKLIYALLHYVVILAMLLWVKPPHGH